MKQTKRRLIAAPLALSCIALLAGCDGDVSAVKDQVYPGIDSSMRLGKALETRTDCENGKWDTYSDDRGRDVVRYTCTLPQLYLDTFKNKALAQYSTPEKEKANSDALIVNIENRRNDVPRLKDYLLANYATLVTLNAADKDILEKASDSLFFINQGDKLNSDGVYPAPDRESADAECQREQASSCDEFYSTQISLVNLFNGLIKSLGYNKDHTSFLIPTPDEDVAESDISSDYDNKNLTGHFRQLIASLISVQRPFLSSDSLNQSYSALITRINAETDKHITAQQKRYAQWLQNYNAIVNNATFTAVQEDFYWYINDNGDPVDNGGTLTFTRNGKSTTVQMKDSDDYLAVAYQSFAPDSIPNIYLNAIGLFYYNGWLINSRGGI